MFRGERFAETLARVEKLEALCKPYFNTLAEAAMRYVLAAPQLSTLIPGMLNRQHVDMNIAYSDGAAFPEELIARLGEHIWIRDYYH
jgi:aryl-alcohol dehydrogenase-like predicted oxidoreductase